MYRLLLLFNLLPLFCRAQNTDPSAGEYVVLHQDPRLGLLVKKQADVNDATIKLYKKTDKGYRIQVINTNDRNLAFSIKAKLLQLYPEQKVYMSYSPPFYKLRVGNFLKKEEAELFKTDLSKIFSQPMYVVFDVIEIKPMTEEEYLLDKQQKATPGNKN